MASGKLSKETFFDCRICGLFLGGFGSRLSGFVYIPSGCDLSVEIDLLSGPRSVTVVVARLYCTTGNTLSAVAHRQKDQGLNTLLNGRGLVSWQRRSIVLSELV